MDSLHKRTEDLLPAQGTEASVQGGMCWQGLGCTRRGAPSKLRQELGGRSDALGLGGCLASKMDGCSAAEGGEGGGGGGTGDWGEGLHLFEAGDSLPFLLQCRL